MVSSFGITALTLIVIAVIAFFASKKRISVLSSRHETKPHSLASYYGLYAAIWTFVPAVILLLIFAGYANQYLDTILAASLREAMPELPASFLDLKAAQVKNIANGLLKTDDAVMAELAQEFAMAQQQVLNIRFASVMLLGLAGFGYAYYRLAPSLKSRIIFENFLRNTFFVAAAVAVLTTIGIITSLLFEAFRFFSAYPFLDFFFGKHWAPNTAFIAAGDSTTGETLGSFGMLPVMAGTLLIALIAMLVAVPIGLFAAIYMAEFASRRVRDIVKPTLEILAGIPTVVYGFFAALTAAPFFRSIGLNLGMDVSSQSALAAGGVMGIMIIPFISSLSDDVISAVPQSLRDGAYGLGSTKGETVTRVVLPAALPGLIGAFLLGISRAIGETMIVVMAAGVSANLTANPLESVTTVTVQIVMLLTGDTVFDSPKTLSAFALGITLFFATLMLNIAALSAARRLGEKYD
jgi:phosphate transport system permease protein